MDYLVFGNALEDLASVVGDGRRSTDPVVKKAVNRAVEYLMSVTQAEAQRFRLKCGITNNSVPLPRNVRSILRCSIDNTPVPVMAMGYELTPGGPDLLNWNGWDYTERVLVDLGARGFPTFYPIGTTPLPLCAFSTSANDRGKTLQVYGTDVNGMILGDPANGIRLPIVPYAGEVYGRIDRSDLRPTEEAVADVQLVVKPVTEGYVSLLVRNPEGPVYWTLAVYHPDDTRPRFRRYRLRYPLLDSDEPMYLTAEAILGFVKLTHTEDILPIQNMEAIRMMILSQRARDAGDDKKAQDREAEALRMLHEQSANERPNATPTMSLDPRLSGGGRIAQIQ